MSRFMWRADARERQPGIISITHFREALLSLGQNAESQPLQWKSSDRERLGSPRSPGCWLSSPPHTVGLGLITTLAALHRDSCNSIITSPPHSRVQPSKGGRWLPRPTHAALQLSRSHCADNAVQNDAAVCISRAAVVISSGIAYCLS